MLERWEKIVENDGDYGID